jgi:hypothetical protein
MISMSNLSRDMILLILAFSICLLHPLMSTQLSFAQNNQAIAITVANSSFMPLTNTDANQVRVNIEYMIKDESIKSERLNAVMKVYAPNGTLLRTTSSPGGFVPENNDGVEALKTTFRDKSLQTVLANITFIDLARKIPISNVITVNLDLEEAPTTGSPLSENTSSLDNSSIDNSSIDN